MDKAEAPFSYLSVNWSLLFGPDQDGRRVELTLAAKLLDGAEHEKDPESAAATWWLDSRRPSIYSQVQPDQPWAHRPKVGAWPSLCMGYDRPSSETGDDFRWTRCFVPGIGVIHITFDSVWGDLRCGLQRSLAHPSLP